MGVMVAAEDWLPCSCCAREKLIKSRSTVVIEFAFDIQKSHDAVRYIDSLPKRPIGVLKERMKNRRPQETKAALLVLMQDYMDGRKLRDHELGALGTRQEVSILEFKCKNLRVPFYETTCAKSTGKKIIRLTSGFD